MPPSKEELKAHFERTAQTYEETFPLMKAYAAQTLSLLPPITADSVVHDNGCGPGIISGTILSAPPFDSGSAHPTIHATDLSPAMIGVLKTKAWADKVNAQVMDATNLTFPDDTFTHSLTNFVLMALPPDVAAKVTGHVHRTLKPGGTAELATWAKYGYLDMFQDVVDQVKPGTRISPAGVFSEHWMKEQTLRDALLAGGFKPEQIQIKSIPYDIPGHIWAKPGLQGMKELLTKQITEEWEETDREALVNALEKRIEQEEKVPRDYTMIAWIAIAEK